MIGGAVMFVAGLVALCLLLRALRRAGRPMPRPVTEERLGRLWIVNREDVT